MIVTKCKDCEHFKIAYQPMMPWDTGLVTCDKYNLECDFFSQRKLNRLTCVEQEEDDAVYQSAEKMCDL